MTRALVTILLLYATFVIDFFLTCFLENDPHTLICLRNLVLEKLLDILFNFLLLGTNLMTFCLFHFLMGGSTPLARVLSPLSSFSRVLTWIPDTLRAEYSLGNENCHIRDYTSRFGELMNYYTHLALTLALFIATNRVWFVRRQAACNYFYAYLIMVLNIALSLVRKVLMIVHAFKRGRKWWEGSYECPLDIRDIMLMALTVTLFVMPE